MWDEQFERILRRHLSFLSENETLTEDLNMRDFGLDSMATVGLLADLEQAYEITFVNDALSMDNFATPGLLWSALSGLRSGGRTAAPRT
jgi:acyl carrier protein